MTAAALFHAALFVLWPTLDTSDPWLDASADRGEIEWLALQEAPAGGPGTPLAALPAGNATQDEDEDEGSEDEDEGDGDDGAGGEDSGVDADGSGEGIGGRGGGTDGDVAALRQRLRRDAPLPSVVEPEEESPVEEDAPEDEEDTAPDADEEGGSTQIGGDPSATAYESLPEADELDMDRLAGFRPELAFSAPTNWVLVRNPSDVEEYMNRIYERGQLDRGEQGTVVVTLWIDEVGSVEWAEVSRSSGQEEMDEAALTLFSDIVSFRPARDRGVRVPISVRFWVNFPW